MFSQWHVSARLNFFLIVLADNLVNRYAMLVRTVYKFHKFHVVNDLTNQPAEKS
jgi:hypothetical protein